MAKKHWMQTAEGKAKLSERMKASWATRKANGANGTEPPKRRRGRPAAFPRIEAHALQELALYGARIKLQQLEQERVALEQFIKRGGKW